MTPRRTRNRTSVWAALLAVAFHSQAFAETRQPAGPAPAFDLPGAIAAAAPGQEIIVPAGVYPSIVIDRPLALRARPGAILDAQGRGDVVRITAPDVTISGFTIRGTGQSLDRENAGVAATAPRATIENNRLEDVLFGIVIAGAPASVVANNTIVGKDLDLGRRGDAIRLWQSPDTIVEANDARQSRDVVVWYSSRAVLRANTVIECRYGLHSMYTDNCVMEDNRLERNSVGIFMMYSQDLEARRNVIADNRGPSGFGIGLKDVDGVTLEDNTIVGNRVGINLDTSPVRSDIHHHHTRNIIAFNDVGVAFMPAVRNNHFQDNAFVENIEDVGILGGGAFEGQNSFTVDGRGNYWSAYRGFDLDADAIGDIEHRSDGLFENLIDREPKLRYFLYSPAQQAIDLAARSFPVVAPRPKLVDTAPWMAPPMRAPTPMDAAASGPFAIIALALAGTGIAVATLAGNSFGATLAASGRSKA
ncbi:MAG: nitrous oxide reductase family maturation protein NosD [Phycisphaerales bacterium]